MKISITLLAVAAFLMTASLAGAVTSGQIDEFEINADSLGWIGGNPIYSPAPIQVPDGGPNGPGQEGREVPGCGCLRP